MYACLLTHTHTHTHTQLGGGGGGLKTSLKARARRAVRKETEFKIFTAEKLLLVKILFEQVRSKASCENRERRLFPHVTNKSFFPC